MIQRFQGISQDPTSPHFLTSKLFASHHITAIFSQRQGGVSPAPFDSLNLGLELGDNSQHIEQNLARLCHAAQLPMPHRSQQTHGTDDLLCQGLGKQHHHKADILLTCSSGCGIAIRTADCLPILLVDPHAGIATAVHAGWRGTASNIAQKAIHQMQELGANPAHILASLGPCIASCCFEVDLSTAKQLSQSHPEAHQHIPIKQQKAWPDLQEINALQLQYMGLKTSNIERISLCTHYLAKCFFSYRRDGIESGRQLAIVALP